MHASLDYLTDLVARYRTHPQPGLLARLLHNAGDELTDRELAALAAGILTGGHETTATMLALGVLPALRRAGPAEEIEFRTLSLIHGLRGFPVTW